MKIEEETLVERFGKQAPFKVPEGYFQSIEQSLMENLPERKTAKEVQMPRTKWMRWRPWAYAAAGFCGAMFVLGTVFGPWQGETPSVSTAAVDHQQQLTSDYTLDQAADYAMIDNAEMYALMVGE
ncbi:MAG: hypothetical protein J5506_02750 [Prevotella sp.]|nr:hypothetical protein [Prevotella sp.]